MRYYLILLLFLFSCSSTKKTTRTDISKTETTQETVKQEVVSVAVKEDLTEVITEKEVVTSNVVKTDSGETITIPVSTVERRIERFKKKTESETSVKKESEETEVIDDTHTELLNKQTEGQDAAKIIESASKGISKGLLDHLFGDSLRKISLAVLFLIFVIVIIVFRKRPKDVDRE